MSYHEAIDLYIEKHTPYLLKETDSKESKFDLVLDGRIIEKDVDTSIQQALLKLKPKSIYTFNYDNALECYSNLVKIPESKEVKDEKLQVIKRLESFIKNEYVNAVDKLKSAVAELRNHPELSETLLPKVEEAVNNFNIKILNQLNGLIRVKEISLNDGKSVLSQCSIISNELDDKIKQLKRQVKDVERNKYLLVTSSPQIAINTYENYIYKVHGTLRKFNEDTMSFEGDIDFDHDRHSQYIITKEDYDTYAEKHEAFVDLMRISLLRDDFCIIGFSCDDPNFLLWINWVKDINDQAKDRQSEISKKYYINVEDKALPEDKLLLLENHQIQILNLFELYDSATTRKQRLSDFFKDLSISQDVTSLYDRLWTESNLFVSKINGHNKPTYNKDDLDLSWYNTLNNPVAFMDIAFNSRRADILLNFERVIRGKIIDNDIARLCYMAANRSNVPFSSFLPNDDELVESAFEPVEDSQLDSMILENYTLQNLLEDGDCNIADFPKDKRYFYGLLKRFYSFDFSDIDDYIVSWQPTYKIGKVIKLVYSSYDPNNIIQTVKSLASREGYVNPQEYYTSLLMLSLFRWRLPYSLLKDNVFEDIDETIEGMSTNTKGLVDFHKYFYDLESRLHEDVVSPLDDKRITIHFSSFNKAEMASIKMINFLCKTGIDPNFATVNIIDKNKWYLVVENAFRYYPSACLFYSSTFFSDNDLSKRIGQLYTYDIGLSKSGMIKKLLTRILNACLLYPTKVNIAPLLVYSCYFMKVVSPDIWKETFKEIFNKNCLYEETADYWRQNIQKYNFVYEGLIYIDDYEFKQEIGTKILSKHENITSFDNNILFACLKDGKISEENQEILKSLLKLKPTLPIVLTVINFRNVVSSRSLIQWIKQVPDDILKDKSLIVAFAILSKEHRSLLPKLYHLVETCPSLWDTGVVIDGDEQKVTQIEGTHTSYIENIERFVDLPIEVIHNIYAKAINRLSEIEKAINQKWINEMTEYWCMILVSIRCFLVKHKKKLADADEYLEVIAKCDDFYKSVSGYSSPTEKILSDKGYRVASAAKELQMLIRTDGLNVHENDVNILLSVILNQNGESLGSCVKMLMQLIIDYGDYFNTTLYKQSLSMILKMYEAYYVKGAFWDLQAEKDEVEELLLRIRSFLKRGGVDVGAWNNYVPQFWYNNKFCN